MNEPRRLLSLLLIVSFLAAAGYVPFVATAAPQPLAAIPAPTGGPRPTIRLSVDRARPGEPVTVSGKGVAPFPGVLVAWLISDSTQTAAVVGRQPSNDYSAEIAVPADAPAGPASICATVTGTPEAEFACAGFTIAPPLPGRVQVQLPAALQAGVARPLQGDGAVVNLYDRFGKAVASAPLRAGDTAVTIPGVPAGSYTAAVAGRVSVLLAPVPVTVGAGETVNTAMSAVSGCLAAMVVAVRADPIGTPTAEYDWGTYLSYWPLSPEPVVTIETDVQVVDEADLGLLEVRLTDPGGESHLVSATDPPTSTTTYITDFVPGAERPGLYRLSLQPNASHSVGGEYCNVTRGAERRVKVIENPIEDNPLQPSADPLDLTWNGNGYDFTIGIPDTVAFDALDYTYPPLYVGDTRVLPIVFPPSPPDLPFLPTPEGRLGAAFRVKGSLDLDGNVRADLMQSRVRAQLFGVEVVDDIEDYLPPGGVSLFPAEPQTEEVTIASVTMPLELLEGLRRFGYPIDPYTIFDFDESLNVFGGNIIHNPATEFTPEVKVSINVDVGIRGKGVLGVTVYPLAPGVDATLHVFAEPRVSIDVEASGYMGMIAAIAEVNARGAVGMPVSMSTLDPRGVWSDGLCLQYQADFAIKIILAYFIEMNVYDKQLVDYTVPEGCSVEPALLEAMQQAPVDRPLRVIAAPDAASGPDGRLLAVYVDDATPDAPQAAGRVVARFWDPEASTWDDPVPLTDGSRVVDGPVAAFYGTGGRAIVAWGQKAMTAAEESAAGQNIAAHLRRMEIFYAVWNGSAWSAPARLTDNNLPDGSPAIAGDSSGATLAWVRDLDADLNTQEDRHVVVSTWDLSGDWSSPEVLDVGPAANKMNSQASVARRGGNSLLAWVADGDADLTTASDRNILVAAPDGAAWEVTAPASLPDGAESPAVALDATGEQAAMGFLLSDDDSSVGTRREVWSARRTGSSWQPTKLLDEQGQPVLGEKPRVEIGPAGETLLLFRRFGAMGTNAELGQIALAQLADDGEPTQPLYLTDEPRQHWQPALAISQQTGEAVVVNVSRAISPTASTAEAAGPSLAPAHSAARPGFSVAALSASQDPVESIVVPPAADPSLDPALALSQQHALVGSQVVVTATVRNLGRAPASDLRVRFYRGTPGDATLLDTVPVPGTLALNESRAVPFQLEATAGEQPIYAEVVPGSGGNTSDENDRAAARLRELPAPTTLRVSVSNDKPGALQLTWTPPPVPGVAGYRILRRDGPGEPFQLVGESTVPVYTDLLLELGHVYSYMVEAYDEGGVLSPRSEEHSGEIPNHRVSLPLVSKQ